MPKHSEFQSALMSPTASSWQPGPLASQHIQVLRELRDHLPWKGSMW